MYLYITLQCSRSTVYKHLMIYLDHNATTPIAPEVVEAMMPYFTEDWGNPSSSYRFGSKLKTVIEDARAQVAELINAKPRELIFTSCATESNNAAIHAALKAKPEKRHIVTSAVEHSSVLNYCRAMEAEGYQVTYLPVDREGLLNIADLENAIIDQTAVVSLMWANNETGVLFPVEQIAKVCKARDVLYHCDAVQAAGKLEVDVQLLQADYLSLSAHKIYGPKGTGALFVREESPYNPLLIGSQENGRRGGTEAVPLIAGFGVAAELAKTRLHNRITPVKQIRDQLEHRILEVCPEAIVNGSLEYRLPNTTNISFQGIDSETLVHLLGKKGVMVSNGSACNSSAITPSHVILAMGVPYSAADEAIRFSLSHLTTTADIEGALEILTAVIESLRAAC